MYERTEQAGGGCSAALGTLDAAETVGLGRAGLDAPACGGWLAGSTSEADGLAIETGAAGSGGGLFVRGNATALSVATGRKDEDSPCACRPGRHVTSDATPRTVTTAVATAKRRAGARPFRTGAGSSVRSSSVRQRSCAASLAHGRSDLASASADGVR